MYFGYSWQRSHAWPPRFCLRPSWPVKPPVPSRFTGLGWGRCHPIDPAFRTVASAACIDRRGLQPLQSAGPCPRAAAARQSTAQTEGTAGGFFARLAGEYRSPRGQTLSPAGALLPRSGETEADNGKWCSSLAGVSLAVVVGRRPCLTSWGRTEVEQRLGTTSRIRHGYDSDSNPESTQNQMVFA